MSTRENSDWLQKYAITQPIKRIKPSSLRRRDDLKAREARLNQLAQLDNYSYTLAQEQGTREDFDSYKRYRLLVQMESDQRFFQYRSKNGESDSSPSVSTRSSIDVQSSSRSSLDVLAKALDVSKTTQIVEEEVDNIDTGTGLTKEDSYQRPDFIHELLKRISISLNRQSIKPAEVPKLPEYERIQKDKREIDREIGRQKRKQPRAYDNFPSLDENAQMQIKNAFGKSGSSTVVSGFNVELQKYDIQTLKPGQWLNDEVINFYGKLIMERAEKDPHNFPCIHMFNTFFYSKLRDAGYASVRTWTRKINLFEKELIIIPVHLGMHWCCAVINMLDHRIEYYDSLHGDNPQLFELLEMYLKEESKDKLKKEFDMSDWQFVTPKDIPGQANGYDCGVFASQYANYLSRNEPFDFSQSHMPYFRNRMVFEILNKKLL